MNRKALGAAALLVVLAGFVGCQKPFTRDNYEMIQVNVDDKYDVEMMIGAPEQDLDDHWIYDDLDEHYSAMIYFDHNGTVIGKEWIDSRTGEWEGTNPHANQPPAGETRDHYTKTRRIDD
jgi:hypothetical protein